MIEKTEYEKFLEWHFEDWRSVVALNDTFEFARILYNSVYSHHHTKTVREECFRAWNASAKRGDVCSTKCHTNKG